MSKYTKTYRSVITQSSTIDDFSVMNKQELLLILAKRLKDLRRERGLTQEEVTDQTGVHVGRIEQGSRDVAFSTLVKLARFFEVELGYFDPDR